MIAWQYTGQSPFKDFVDIWHWSSQAFFFLYILSWLLDRLKKKSDDPMTKTYNYIDIIDARHETEIAYKVAIEKRLKQIKPGNRRIPVEQLMSEIQMDAHLFSLERKKNLKRNIGQSDDY